LYQKLIACFGPMNLLIKHHISNIEYDALLLNSDHEDRDIIVQINILKHA
jgi:hypothetical protein